MGNSLRARAVLKRWREEREAARRENLAAELAAEREFHAEFLDRDRAAAALGISVHTLKRWTMAGRGPTPTKFGDARQSRVRWRAEEITTYLADPAGYERAKATPAR